MNKNITALVYTRNEERRLPYVYENLRGFCEIIVFDGGSTDGTEEFCRKNGIKFVRRITDDFEPGLRWVFEKTPTEYVMHVYCAHIYPQELLDQFAIVANEGKYEAVFHDVVIYRYGEVVHRPHFRRISSGCNFYKKSVVNFNESKIHDELAIRFSNERMLRLEAKDSLSLHLFQDDDCESFTKKTINYCVTEANQKFPEVHEPNIFKMFFGALGRFVYWHIRTGAFTKGSKGLVYSIMNLIYDINLSVMIWERSKKLLQPNSARLNDEMKKRLLTNYKGTANKSM